MIDKFLESKGVRRIVTLLMVVTFFIGAFCVAYPATRKSDTIRFLGATGASATRAASAAFTAFADTEITALLSNPQISPEFKELSGMLTRISNENKYGAMYMVYRGVGGKYYTLLDSRYRDTGTAGTDYFAPGKEFSGEIFKRTKSSMNTIYDKKTRAGFDHGVHLNQNNEKVVISFSGVFSAGGDVLGVLITETAAEHTDFSSLGIFDLNIIAVVCFVLFGILVAMAVLMKKWRESRSAKAKGDKSTENAKAAEAYETKRLDEVAKADEPTKPAESSATTPEAEEIIETISPEDIDVLPPDNKN